MNKFVAVALVVALGVGCGSKDDKPSIANFGTPGGSAATGGKRSAGGESSTSTAGTTTTAGTTGIADGGAAAGAANGGGGAGGSSVGVAPTVAITSPIAVASPDTGPVLIANSVEVLCSAAPGSADVQTVTIAYTDAAGNTSSAAAVNRTANLNEYSAQFSLTTVPSGGITFTCTATDKMSLNASSTIQTYVDHGPAIAMVSPLDGAAVSGKSSLPVSFTVTPVPLTTLGTDLGQAIYDVALTVNGVTIATKKPDPADPTLYTANVNLADTTLFPQALTGKVSVSVSALNSRNLPEYVQSMVTRYIYIDSTPPTVKIINPANYQVVGGPTELGVTVSDGANGSGVSATSVHIEYGDLASDYSPSDPLWRNPSAGTYYYTFDTKLLDPLSAQVQVTLTARASDKVGNIGTDSIHVYLDNQPPFISLDPPLVRVTRPATGGVYCSVPFDPVGTAATSLFGNTYPTSYVRVRALVMEQTNNNGGAALFFAGMDQSSVWLYASDASTPLLVGSAPGVGPCSDINAAVKVAGFNYKMSPVPTYSTDPDSSKSEFVLTPPIETPSACVLGSSGSSPICGGTSDLKYVMPQYYDKTESAIYATDVVNDISRTTCAGYQIDLLANPAFQEGWVCLAAQGADKVHNSAVSAPLAVCLNRSGTADCSEATKPTCTDGCIPPSRSILGDDASGDPIPFVFSYSPY